MDDPHRRIAQLEAQIEALAADAERCRKLDGVAKAAMLAGGAWLTAGLLGIVWMTAAATLIAISAVLLGLVLKGSNGRTWAEVTDKLAARRAERERLIDALDPKLVQPRVLGVSGRLLH